MRQLVATGGIVAHAGWFRPVGRQNIACWLIVACAVASSVLSHIIDLTLVCSPLTLTTCMICMLAIDVDRFLNMLSKDFKRFSAIERVCSIFCFCLLLLLVGCWTVADERDVCVCVCVCANFAATKNTTSRGIYYHAVSLNSVHPVSW